MKLQWYPGTVRDRNGSQELQRDRYVSQGLQRYHSAAMGPEDGIETAMAATAMGRTAVGPCNCYGTIMGPRAHIGTAIAAIGFQRPLMGTQCFLVLEWVLETWRHPGTQWVMGVNNLFYWFEKSVISVTNRWSLKLHSPLIHGHTISKANYNRNFSQPQSSYILLKQ